VSRRIPLFLPQPRETPLQLDGCQWYPGGLAQLSYRIPATNGGAERGE
jgi:hypothetical protein